MPNASISIFKLIAILESIIGESEVQRQSQLMFRPQLHGFILYQKNKRQVK